MIAANDNRRTLSDREFAAWLERLRQEFDLLCLAEPSEWRIERELAAAGFA